MQLKCSFFTVGYGLIYIVLLIFTFRYSTYTPNFYQTKQFSCIFSEQYPHFCTVFYIIFNQSCIYIYLQQCPFNPVGVDFSPRINDDSTHIIRPNKDPDSIFMKSTDPDLTNFARLLENKK